MKGGLMNITLKNKEIAVKLSTLGGTLTSIRDQADVEYLWQGDPQFWSGQAPILFPICGSIRDDQDEIGDGMHCRMPRHGLIRKLEFNLMEFNDCSAIFSIESNENLKKSYPYEFLLYAKYTIENGTVMRVSVCKNSAGGKGLNVARVIKLCNADVKATGLIGGYNGAYLEALLDQDEISHEFGKVDGETRSCINILDPQFGSTEYLEPGFTVSKQDIDHYLEEFRQIIADSDVVTISGSAPKGSPKDIYQYLVQIAKQEGKKVILQNCNNKLHTFAPHHTCGVKS